MDLRITFSSGVPIYLQLMEQIKHAVETGVVRSGEQLPTIRAVAEELAMNPNTVARAYRELEREGVIVVRHGAGAYVSENKPAAAKAAAVRKAGEVLHQAIGRAFELDITEAELRRVFENELSLLQTNAPSGRQR